ncbi:hypothetical protein M426DRAFT_8227 [Hypoxylon sp. CI-4A]|nr:hypothetical protein M426DRAFT_8227 [Hypoxylon sp. CI-4A]
MKRIVICCDGTWQNSDNGYVKPTSSNPVPTLQIPSNVTRISRAFKRSCSDDTTQIVYYQSGVGSSSSIIDRVLGGAFGIGIAEVRKRNIHPDGHTRLTREQNIREAYAYICANYEDGDEIILVGFSRGAFTARSIGGMISDLGLLTREGMEFFYPIFKDMQNWMNTAYKDQFPEIPFTDKPKGPHASDEYRERLVEKGYTRARQSNGKGELIKVKAIGVLSNKIEHAFHALALDETRGPFSPTLWERQPEYRDSSDLRQVWFPGSHGNVGGGWDDQGVANICLAWMMDQLSSVGCEFVEDAIERLYDRNVQYYHNHKPLSKREKCAKCCCSMMPQKEPLPWAVMPIFTPNKPVRPWSLHSIQSVSSPLYDLVGSVTRSPGMYRKINPENGRYLKAYLKDTNERIHSSVRVRLACAGLGLNDSKVWECPALLRAWRPQRMVHKCVDPIPDDAGWGPKGDSRDIPRFMDISNESMGGDSSAPSEVIYDADEDEPEAAMRRGKHSGEPRWVWEYIGPDKGAPYVKTLVEEKMGPWEKHLLALSSGKVQVCEYADAQDVQRFKAFGSKTFLKKMKELKKSGTSKSSKS